MTLPITQLSQRDPRWANLLLGKSGLTVGQFGCTFTAGVMAAQAFGKALDLPTVLAACAAAPDAFNGDGTVNWLPFARELGLDFGYRMDTTANVAPNHLQVSESAALRHLDWLATLGVPVLCWVDTDHDGKANHWVLSVGEGYCLDPWDGQKKELLPSFGHLYGLAIFNGTPVMAENGKVGALVGKANEISRGRNVALNASEIMQVVNRP